VTVLGVLIVLGALALLMTVAYRGVSVIVCAPVVALLAVLATDPAGVAPIFTGVYMERLAGFVRSYLPVFLLGALFGRLIDRSGAARAITEAIIAWAGPERAMLAIAGVCAALTYGGVSLFVVVFAAYPFAVEMFRRADIPKRLMPATIVLGAFTFTMDALPGTPQIQNLIPTTFFGTTAWAAPGLGCLGAVVIALSGLSYLEWRRRAARRAGEGYGDHQDGLAQGAAAQEAPPRMPALLAILPLVVVGVANRLLTDAIPRWYGATAEASLPGLAHPVATAIPQVTAIWAVSGALVLGLATILATSWRALCGGGSASIGSAVSGALLATINTASEYGFGAVIAALPGFISIRDALRVVPDTLVNMAVSVSALAGITGSASGGMSIALAALGERFLAAAQATGIPPEVLHRVAAMASGGMDTLPHNGAVITLLAVTGMTHRQSYRDIFAITGIKTAAVAVVILAYRCTGLV
jgi:H+/gluconate symporter-like permease